MTLGSMGMAVLGILALTTIISCEGFSQNRQLPPPPGPSVHESPSLAGPPPTQGSVDTLSAVDRDKNPNGLTR